MHDDGSNDHVMKSATTKGLPFYTIHTLHMLKSSLQIPATVRPHRVCRSQEDSEGERARRQREIEESEDDLRRLREELNDIMTRKRNLEDAMKHHEDDVRKIESVLCRS